MDRAMVTAVTFPLVITATFAFWSKQWLDASDAAKELDSTIDAGIGPATQAMLCSESCF
jgi:hypothetical protein